MKITGKGYLKSFAFFRPPVPSIQVRETLGVQEQDSKPTLSSILTSRSYRPSSLPWASPLLPPGWLK